MPRDIALRLLYKGVEGERKIALLEFDENRLIM